MENNQSVRRHLDTFIEVESLGKLEEGRSVTGVWLQSQKKQAADSGRNRPARRTTRATGRPISRFTVAQKTVRWWSVCTPCTVCTFNACIGEGVLCVPGTPEWRDNEWGRVLFTDESRFSLSSDSHRILIWKRAGSRNHPRTSLKGTGMEVAVFSFGEASCLVVVQTFTSSTQVQSAGLVILTRFFFPYVRLFRALWVYSSLFMDDNAPCNRTVAAEQLLE
ncbi:transposable element Tcb1 transposase [Trichonephila clavipes]|nr:transposable element Tcb1 transposase [Trichonephila clavipes]